MKVEMDAIREGREATGAVAERMVPCMRRSKNK